MQYYLEYTLGWRGLSGKKADKGTICHKVLEITALAKKAAQEGKKTITDEDLGKVDTANYEPEYLEELIQKAYDLYTSHSSQHKWAPRDLKDCSKWVWKALKENDGMFDPRNRDVVDAEPHFDFEIEEEWAKYDYELGDGTKLSGNLSLKGTIDLIADVGDGVYEIIDWKTGRRLDWATGEEKTQEKLFKDPQLRMYHYAAKKLYPHVDSFLVTIYFINDGGPFTVHFQDKDLPKTIEMIQKKFEFIKATEKPLLKRSWKCSKLCHQGKSTFEGTDILPIVEKRAGQVTKYGENMTKCEQTKYLINKHGIDWVTENLTSPDHVIGKYKAPGEMS
tara:strand:+ start:13762 stop:14763 length:1002 start_codon:yes stop_codon:yes gene_type:complete